MAEDVERTPDGRYIVVGGRRWRASDTGIPDNLRSELVGELMRARRAVRSRGDEVLWDGPRQRQSPSPSRLPGDGAVEGEGVFPM